MKSYGYDAEARLTALRRSWHKGPQPASWKDSGYTLLYLCLAFSAVYLLFKGLLFAVYGLPLTGFDPLEPAWWALAADVWQAL